MGRYSNLCEQGERFRELLEMVPSGPLKPTSRTIRKNQRRLRDAELDRLVAGYQSGATVYELADQFGVHRHTVSDILERNDVPRRYQKLSSEQIETARSLYRSGLSLTKIGHQVDRSAETIRQALLRVGIQMRPRNGQ